MKRRLIMGFIILIMVLGIGLMAYPSLANFINNQFSISTIGDYNTKVEKYNKEEIDKIMKDAYDYASLHHFDYWTTVLSVSPHKNSQWINEIGASFAQNKTKFLFSDFKKNNGYLKSVRFADSYHLYRQSYCGCVYSYQDMLKRKKDVEDDGTNL